MEVNNERKLTGGKFDIWDFIRSNNHLITLISLMIIATLLTRGIFLRPSNLFSVVTRATALGMIAIGQTLVILTAGIDLSVAANVGLCIGMMYFVQSKSIGAGYMMIVGSMAPAAVGLTNGLFCAFTRVPPFIVTLAMSMIVKAITLGGIQPGATVFEDVQIFVNTRIMGSLPIRDQMFPVIIWIVSAALWVLMLRYSRFGHNLYAIGGKERAAYYAGVNVKKVKIIVYTVSGLFSGVGGVLYAYKLGGTNPVAGGHFLLESIAATVIGGTALTGGEGGIFGTLIGTMVMAMLVNTMNIIEVNYSLQRVVLGVIFIMFVYVLNKIRQFAIEKQYSRATL
ncbi:MAG: ABC transporter permease [Spirochaetes bacterium]|nr:ABC transporter permease [Spirochaetota bacterium]